MRNSIHCVLFTLLTISLATSLRANEPASAPAGDLHDRLIADYLDGNWDELSNELTKSAKEVAALPRAQKVEMDYIRKAVADGRPAWWKQAKAGGKFHFRPVVWGQTLIASFDPGAKTNVQINFVDGAPSVVLSWDVKDMDNPAEAEHGFSKGELNDMSVWQTLGTAESWEALSLQSQRGLDEAGKLLLSRYLLFRGCLTAAYYGTPRARRWDFWLGTYVYNAEHDSEPMIMSRRAIGAILICEVLGHPKTYPSINLSDFADGELTEARLAPRFQDFLGKKPFTLSEDMALRDAVKALAATNEIKVRVSGKLLLGNGLPLSLDAATDALLAAERDKWIKKQFDGVSAPKQ